MPETTNNLLRMSDEDLVLLIGRLNHETGPVAPAESNRACKRWPTTFQRMILTIRASANERQHLVCVPRNLSTGGLACIHGGFLHPGTSCHVTLQSRGRDGRTIEAEVVRCRHIERHLHDIGIKFVEPINPGDFLIEAGPGPMFNAERVNPKDLEGTVLVAMPERTHQRVITQPFRSSEIEFLYATDGTSALSLLSETPSLVYAACNLGDMSGTDFVRRAAEEHPTIPIVLVAADESVGLRREALAAGAREMLTLPCDPHMLLRSAAEFLLLGDLLSHASENTPDRAVIDARTLRRLGQDLSAAMVADDPATAIETVHEIRTLADANAFAVVAKRARQALEATKESGHLALDDLAKLIRSCERAEQEAAERAHPPTPRAA